MQVALIDYGASNLRSVEKALEAAGAQVTKVDLAEKLGGADVIVVPGQGHFGHSMAQIRARGFEEALKRKVFEEKIPYIGICIGFQILFDESEEAPGVAGLGWLKGRVVRFRGNLKIPHMGWNEVRAERPHPALDALGVRGSEPPFFYFVHSYYPEPVDPSVVLATCDYGVRFACAVQTGPILAVQFHPEKSQQAGKTFLSTLLAR